MCVAAVDRDESGLAPAPEFRQCAPPLTPPGPAPQWRSTVAKASSLRKWATSAAHITAFTVVSGAFVAGLDAGLIYNTWPLMGEDWIPEDIGQLKPWWKNPLENSTTVQFQHRYLVPCHTRNFLFLLLRHLFHSRPTPPSARHWAPG